MTDEAPQPVAPPGPVDMARNDVSKAHKQLAERANDVFQATATFVADLVESQVEAFVIAQPARTDELKRKGVERLEGDLAAARTKLTEESWRRLKDAFSWAYPQAAPAWIGEADRLPLYQGGTSLPWMIDDTIRGLVTTAARLAAGAGYDIWPEPPVDKDPATRDRPRLPPSAIWEKGADGGVARYLGPYGAPAPLVVALRSYSDARLRYFRRLRALRRLEADLRDRDARIEDEVVRNEVVQPAAALWSEARQQRSGEATPRG
jgi:hypothetical protein